MKRFRMVPYVALGVAMLLASCNGANNSAANGEDSSAGLPEVAVTPDAAGEAIAPTDVSTDAPTDVPADASLTATAPDAEGRLPNDIIPNTAALQRLPQVQTGRSNPFAALTVGPARVSARPPAPPAAPTLVQGTLLPTTDGAAPVAPATPVVSVPASPTVIPAVAPVAPAAPVVPQSLASQIRVSGIVQIGSQYQVLLELPNESFSRSFRVGEDVVAGRVRLARVDVAPNREPWIILLENGQETIKTVDNGG